MFQRVKARNEANLHRLPISFKNHHSKLRTAGLIKPKVSPKRPVAQENDPQRTVSDLDQQRKHTEENNPFNQTTVTNSIGNIVAAGLDQKYANRPKSTEETAKRGDHMLSPKGLKIICG